MEKINSCSDLLLGKTLKTLYYVNDFKELLYTFLYTKYILPLYFFKRGSISFSRKV